VGNRPRAPSFELRALDGVPFRLDDVRGKKVVLLEFWATWCQPCLFALPHLDQLYRRYAKEGLLVVGVAIDGPETAARVPAEAGRLSLSFPILLDEDTEVVSQFAARAGPPVSVLIGRDGAIWAQREGAAAAAFADVEREIRAALAVSTSP
jgi:peroxiredoxin